MWVRARCTIHNSVPIALARAAEKRGVRVRHGIARHFLQLAIGATWASTSLCPRGEAGRATSAERLTRSRCDDLSPDLDQWSPEGKARLLASIQDRGAWKPFFCPNVRATATLT